VTGQLSLALPHQLRADNSKFEPAAGALTDQCCAIEILESDLGGQSRRSSHRATSPRAGPLGLSVGVTTVLLTRLRMLSFVILPRCRIRHVRAGGVDLLAGARLCEMPVPRRLC
jgi:hypothetical protein